MRIAFIVFSLLLASITSHAAQKDNATVKEWTFLTYLNGNNSLDSYGPYNLKEMEKVGSTDQLNVVVQWASESAGDVKRLYIQKSTDDQNVTSPVVQDMGKVDMGDYHSLIDFIKWGVQNYPAKKYFINVWNHGGGWHFQTMGLGNKLFAAPGSISPMDISWDDTTGHFISTIELGQAITQAAQIIGHKVDIYGSDACMMAMPEVATEMAEAVSVYAGSEETEPGAGWPYTDFLSDWVKNPTATASQVATYLTNDYAASYNNGSHGTQDVTFAAYDMTKLNEFITAVKDLSTNIRALNADGKAKAATALSQTKTFAYSDYADLVDFTTHLNSQQLAGMDRPTSGLTAAVNDFVISNATTGAFNQIAHGISIWAPQDGGTLSQYLDRYKQLKFEAATSWAEAVQFLVGSGN